MNLHFTLFKFLGNQIFNLEMSVMVLFVGSFISNTYRKVSYCRSQKC